MKIWLLSLQSGFTSRFCLPGHDLQLHGYVTYQPTINTVPQHFFLYTAVSTRKAYQLLFLTSTLLHRSIRAINAVDP